MGNHENTIFNLVLKLTFPSVQYNCVQIVHYMIHLHYHVTFQSRAFFNDFDTFLKTGQN